MLTEYYNNVTNYLTDTFSANFILLTMLLTTATSVVYFIVISYLITQLDTRYFVRNKKVHNKISDEGTSETSHSMLISGSVSFVVNIVKITFGIVLLVCGIVMLVLPGQGLITIVIGLSLIPFPGKDKLEQNILSRKSVRSSLNWIRIKANKAPFVFD